MTRRVLAIRITAASVGLIAAAAASYLLLGGASAAAREPLGRNWTPAQQVSMDDIDHGTYDALLKKYVDGDGYVDYSAWQNSAVDHKALQDYLTALSRASNSTPATNKGQLAFWINAYNAVTLEGILQVYPTDSIRKHTSKLGGYNIWQDLPLLVGGKQFSLEDIEHQVLRTKGEPRIHFAIVCASVGCPRLRNEAYTADRLDEQLADNTRDFFSRPQNLKLDGNTLSLSSILDWFGSDFGEDIDQRLPYLGPYFPAPAQQAAANSRTKVKYLEYNWSLNDQSRKAAAVGARQGSGRR